MFSHTIRVSTAPSSRGLQRVFDTETILSSVLADFVEVFLNQSFLLNELDIRKGFSCEFDCLEVCPAEYAEVDRSMVTYLVESIFASRN